jgi:hypothetical protein
MGIFSVHGWLFGLTFRSIILGSYWFFGACFPIFAVPFQKKGKI